MFTNKKNKKRNKMKNRFIEKVVLITGATGGIGSALCRKISEEGGKVVLCSRSEDSLKSLQNDLVNESLVAVADITKSDEINAVVKNAEDKFGKVDVLIHSVGSILLRALHSTTDEQFINTINLNLTSAFNSIKAVLPSMIKNKKGAVVGISSVAASTGLMNHEAISAAKGGLESLIRSAAITYAKRGIRFNAVALGLVDTPLSEFLTKSENSLNASEKLHPMGRIGKIDDIAEAILYLASDESKWTTGAVIPVDGGMAAGKSV